MKNQKGMTLITTIILGLVIAALVFAIVYYARIAYAKNALEDLKTDLLLVQAKVQHISGEYTLNKKKETLKGIPAKDMQEEEAIKQFIENTKINIDEKGKLYYIFNKDTLAELEISKVNLEENSYYFVDYSNNDIYYTKGFTYVDGSTYYKITDIEELETENVK